MPENAQTNTGQIAVIVGGGPGISASCARLFSNAGMRVAIAARNREKPVLKALNQEHGVRLYSCDASEPAAIEKLFADIKQDMGVPKLVVHNIDGRSAGVRRESIAEVDAALVLNTLINSAYSAFLVGQQAARLMLAQAPDINGQRGTIIYTNASAALKGFAKSAGFAMACQAKSGLAQSMARELMPQGIHVSNIPIDGAIGWKQTDGTRSHRLAGTSVDDHLLDPEHIAALYLQLHNQHRSTWAYEVVLRPWLEKW
jgi:NAD(P)-dependent dehydrogenase (short-subunit alcohol dehydrogenase family)